MGTSLLVDTGPAMRRGNQGWQVPTPWHRHKHPTAVLVTRSSPAGGGTAPHVSVTACPWQAGVPPGPRSEQLCPLRPQAAQRLGALVPRAVPQPAGPTGQVLALALGQVIHLLSPRFLSLCPQTSIRHRHQFPTTTEKRPSALSPASRPSCLGGQAPVTPSPAQPRARSVGSGLC